MSEYNLERFIKAQKDFHEIAVKEIRNGRKQSHWMWFIFPQIAGLGFSETTHYYAISNLEEATLYLNHEILGHRLIYITNDLLYLPTNKVTDIFDTPDDMKLRSSMTLFMQVKDAPACF